MPPKNDKAGEAQSSDADFAQAFKDLARGEKTASALESQLSSIEQRIDDMLAQAEAKENGTSDSKTSENAILSSSKEHEKDHQ